MSAPAVYRGPDGKVVWDDDLREFVRGHWLTSSTQQIADMLGVTKNQVIGASHRIGLPLKSSRLNLRAEPISGRSRRWPTERRALFIKLWNELTPPEDIAHECRCSIRSVYRMRELLNLPVRKVDTAPRCVYERSRSPSYAERLEAAKHKMERDQAEFSSAVVRSAEMKRVQGAERVVTRVAVRPTLPAVGPVRECQWPLTEGRPWRFCCGPTVPGKSFCDEHQLIAYPKQRPEAREGSTPFHFPTVVHAFDDEAKPSCPQRF